ncbi:hypothetical protein [Shewanella sp. SNU WT4]|nr:hypothetical protein [Shewanella sp. SNU WT4]
MLKYWRVLTTYLQVPLAIQARLISSGTPESIIGYQDGIGRPFRY